MLPLTAARIEISAAALTKEGGDLYFYLYDRANEAFDAKLKSVFGPSRIARALLMGDIELDPEYHFSQVELDNTTPDDRERHLARWRSRVARGQERLPPINELDDIASELKQNAWERIPSELRRPWGSEALRKYWDGYSVPKIVKEFRQDGPTESTIRNWFTLLYQANPSLLPPHYKAKPRKG